MPFEGSNKNFSKFNLLESKFYDFCLIPMDVEISTKIADFVRASSPAIFSGLGQGGAV